MRPRLRHERLLARGVVLAVLAPGPVMASSFPPPRLHADATAGPSSLLVGWLQMSDAFSRSGDLVVATIHGESASPPVGIRERAAAIGPSLATTADGFMAAWPDPTTERAQILLLTEAGIAGADTPAAMGERVQANVPALLGCEGDRCVAAWTQRRTDNIAAWDIGLAWWLGSAATAMLVGGATGVVSPPRALAFDGTWFVVPYMKFNGRIEVLRVRAADGLIAEPNGILLFEGGTNPTVAAARELGLSLVVWNIFEERVAVRMDAEGRILGDLISLFATTTTDDPDVAYDGERFLLAWTQGQVGGPRIHAHRIDVAGRILEARPVEVGRGENPRVVVMRDGTVVFLVERHPSSLTTALHALTLDRELKVRRDLRVSEVRYPGAPPPDERSCAFAAGRPSGRGSWLAATAVAWPFVLSLRSRRRPSHARTQRVSA